jgi:allophanate hydrolase subunit 1
MEPLADLRVDFMAPQVQDQERCGRLRKLVQHIKASRKGGSATEALHVSWDDLLDSQQVRDWLS